MALYQPLLDRMRASIKRALRDARVNAPDLDEVLLVGGTTRMPLVRGLVARLFGRVPSMPLNPTKSWPRTLRSKPHSRPGMPPWTR